MSRVMSILSKNKEQMEEFSKIKNAKFDKSISKAKEKVGKLEAEKEEFNKQVSEYIANLKD